MYPFAIDFTVKGLLGLFITNVRGHEQSCYLGQVYVSRLVRAGITCAAY